MSSSIINRKHGALQESLASVTYLHDIVKQCKTVGLDIEATAQHEVASVLWDQGEAETSIRMRQYLINHTDFDSQNADISLPVLLAKLVRILFHEITDITNGTRAITWLKLGWKNLTQSLKTI